jgi:tetratricopeptide (TPR) repeat protein
MEVKKMDMETTGKIEEYLEGALSERERLEMEALAARDASFSELLQMHREINESIRDNERVALQNTLVEISSSYKREHPAGIKRRVIGWPAQKVKMMAGIAASLALIIMLGLFIGRFGGRERGDKLYDKFYQRYEPGMISRSSSGVSSMTEALIDYESSRYSLAFSRLSDLVHSDPENMLAKFFLGLTCLEMQNPEAAVDAFYTLPESWDSPYAIHRDWYLALALLKTGEEEKALALFVKLHQSAGFYRDDAGILVDRLKR